MIPIAASFVTCALSCTSGTVQRFIRSGSAKGTNEDLRKILTFLNKEQMSFSKAKTLQSGDAKSLKNGALKETVQVVLGDVDAQKLPVYRA